MTAQVTIITPTYNKPALFTECARSVLAQTYQDWVWWVVFNAPKFNYHYWREEIWNDPRVNLMLYPATEDTRHIWHVPARIVNWLYPKVHTPYIYFLADDDLIDPDGLGVLVETMENTNSPIGEPDTSGNRSVKPHLFPCQAVYGRCEVQDQQHDGSFKHACWCYESGDVGLGTGIEPSCLLDGGQVLHTKALWDQATQCPTCMGSGQIIPHISLPKPCPDCTGTGTSWQLDDSKADAAANDGTLLNRLAQFARFHYVPQRIVTHRRTRLSSFHKPQGVPQ